MNYREYILNILEEAQRYFTKTGYEELLPFKDDPDVYISYRSINKLGINPNNKYNTPIGIYAYPIKEIWKNIEKDKSSRSVPFAGDNPYIYVFKLKPEFKESFIEDAYSYSSGDYDRDIQKLQEFVEKNYKVPYQKFVSLVQSASSSANVRNPFGILWFLTKLLSDYIYGYITNRSDVKASADVIWNVLLRKGLGWCGVADKRGQGIIHQSEPTQAVFLTKECIEELKVVRNIDSKGSYKELKGKLSYNSKEEKVIFKNDFIVVFNNKEYTLVKNLKTGDIKTYRDIFTTPTNKILITQILDQSGLKRGIITNKGVEIIKPTFQDITPIINNLYKFDIKENKSYKSFIGRVINNKMINISGMFDWISDDVTIMNKNYIAVANTNKDGFRKYGMFDLKSNKLVIPTIYSDYYNADPIEFKNEDDEWIKFDNDLQII